MVSNVRLQRLEADYQAMRELVRLTDKVQVEGVSGKPPTLYRLVLKVHSTRANGETISFADEHRVEIRLPMGYPRNPPVCRMLTPVFHPNIAPHSICIGDHWAAGESLTALVMRICEMLGYQSYNIKSPLNGDAARWTEEHINDLPIDASNFFIDPNEFGIPKSVKLCSNCGTRTTDEPITCSEGHILCSDCAIHCEVCGQLQCLVCGQVSCPNNHEPKTQTQASESPVNDEKSLEEPVGQAKIIEELKRKNPDQAVIIEELVRQIAEMDDLRANGQLDENAYNSVRQELKERLAALLKSNSDSQQ